MDASSFVAVMETLSTRWTRTMAIRAGLCPAMEGTTALTGGILDDGRAPLGKRNPFP